VVDLDAAEHEPPPCFEWMKIESVPYPESRCHRFNRHAARRPPHNLRCARLR
jgi:hypothetical protein